MVVTQLVKKSSIPSSLIVAIVLYGNPYFKGGAPQNACSAVSLKITPWSVWMSVLRSAFLLALGGVVEIRIGHCLRYWDPDAITVLLDCV